MSGHRVYVQRFSAEGFTGWVVSDRCSQSFEFHIDRPGADMVPYRVRVAGRRRGVPKVPFVWPDGAAYAGAYVVTDDRGRPVAVCANAATARLQRPMGGRVTVGFYVQGRVPDSMGFWPAFDRSGRHHGYSHITD